MDILLIEPNHRNKYPPLGLMKIATFHKNRNDNVQFFKGNNKDYYSDYGHRISWDRIYIGAVFTFQYQYILKAINLAKKIIKFHNFKRIIKGFVPFMIQFIYKMGKQCHRFFTVPLLFIFY